MSDLTCSAGIITDYKNLTIKDGVNQLGPLSFLLIKTERNEHLFDKIENESLVEYEGNEYRIKISQRYLVKNTPIRVVQEARHRFYDLIDDRRYTTLSTGAKSINEYLSFIFNGTRWTFSVIDSFGTKTIENFGNDNCLALFNKVIETFSAEFEISGTNINIRTQIGSYIDMQFRHSHNIKAFKENIDTSNLSTYIKGVGKKNEDGTPIVTAEYQSPNAALYKDENGNIVLKHAPVYENETITQESTMIEHLKKEIQDEPDISMELEFAILKDAGYTKPIPEAGDVVPTILEDLGIDVDLRIMEIERYQDTNQSPKVTLSNYKNSFANTLINYQKSLLNKIWDENSGKLRYNVYEEAVQKATEALNNSLTELEYPPNMGILARDPNDPNKFVAFRSAGIGLTTDGGQTFRSAITADGVVTDVLTAGQIKTNNIQIIGNDDLFYWDGNYLIAIDAADASKFVKLNSGGLYIAKGALTIERTDGYKVILDGILQNSFAIFASNPPFQTTGVEKFGQFYKTLTDNRFETVQRFTFKHDSRYIRIVATMFTENGATGSMTFDLADDTNETILQSATATENRWADMNAGSQGYRKDIIMDLGVPTGNLLMAYWRQYADGGNACYGAVRYMVQEG